MADDAISEVITEPPGPEPQIIGPPARRELRGGVPTRMKVTERDRDWVRHMAEVGVPQKEMCRHFLNPNTGEQINVQTLIHYFRREITEGMASADVKLSQTAYHMAVGHKAEYDDKGQMLRAEQKPDRKMLIFQMRVRLKYSDRLVIEHRKAEEDDFSNVVKDLSPDELWQLRALLAKPVQGTDGGPAPEDGPGTGGKEP